MATASKKVQVVRSFYVGGTPQKVGAIIEVPYGFALEMIAARKATDEFTSPALPVEAPPKQHLPTQEKATR